MICAEWWAFQFFTVIAGTIGVPEQAAQVMITSISHILFMVPLGVQEATCGIIGNCVGGNNVPLAVRFFHLIAKINVGIVLILCALTLTLRP